MAEHSFADGQQWLVWQHVFKLHKQTWQQKSKRQFLNIYSLEFWDILENFSFHCILSNENFKMEDLWHV